MTRRGEGPSKNVRTSCKYLLPKSPWIHWPWWPIATLQPWPPKGLWPVLPPDTGLQGLQHVPCCIHVTVYMCVACFVLAKPHIVQPAWVPMLVTPPHARENLSALGTLLAGIVLIYGDHSANAGQRCLNPPRRSTLLSDNACPGFPPVPPSH